MPPAVVLGGEGIAVSIVRSLGQAEIPVHLLGDRDFDPGRHSRWCTGFTDLPVTSGRDRWLEWLRRRPVPGAVLLPGHDAGLELLTRNQAELRELGYHTGDLDSSALMMLDKDETYVGARRAGVESPRYATLRARGDADAAARTFSYPCAVKPIRSDEFTQLFGSDRKLLVAHSRSEVHELLDQMSELGLKVMLTEIVPGSDDRLFSYCGYFAHDGLALVEFGFRKIRQFPPGFGLSCYAAADWDDEAGTLGRKFARALRLCGPVEIEWKRDPRDQRLKLIECNNRFTVPQLQLSSVNLPLLAYRRALGHSSGAPGRRRRANYLWNPIEDTRAFIAYRRSGEWTTGGWIASLLRGQRLHVFRWDDPMPTIAFHWRWMRRLVHRLTRGVGARVGGMGGHQRADPAVRKALRRLPVGRAVGRSRRPNA